MLLNILHTVLVFAEVVLLFNILILVHELGHFLAARYRGMVVERFAIWFGKPIWKKKINGVEYCLGSIPAGGYVALPQMADMETIEGKNENKPEALPPATPWSKIIVAFAGPLFSFGLAVVFACIVWAVGRPVNEIEASTKIGYIEPGSAAEKAGLKTMDVITEIDGHKIKRFLGTGNSITWRIIVSEGETIHMKVLRGNEIIPIDFKPTYKPVKWWQRRSLREIPFTPADNEIKVASIFPNSPAAVARLKSGDVIVALAGEPIYSSAAVSHYMDKNPNAPVPLTIRRDGHNMEFMLVPEVPVEPKSANLPPMLGIAWASHLHIIHPNPVEQITDSVDAVVSTLEALLSPNTNVNASHMQGPIGIMNVLAILFQSEEGWRQALWLTVLLNVNLAIINLLPLPVLDGGHIVLSIIEWIRRKPNNVRVLEVIQTGCAMLIFGFMIYVTFFDVQDLGFSFSKQPQIKFAPKTTSSVPGQ